MSQATFMLGVEKGKRRAEKQSRRRRDKAGRWRFFYEEIINIKIQRMC